MNVVLVASSFCSSSLEPINKLEMAKRIVTQRNASTAILDPAAKPPRILLIDLFVMAPCSLLSVSGCFVVCTGGYWLYIKYSSRGLGLASAIN
jgi:hypothetical protein